MSREIIVDTLSVLSGRFSAGPSALGLPMLLAASCLFYMAFVPAYIGILAITILIDYVAGIRIEAATGTRRQLWARAQHRVHLRGAVRLQVLRLLQRHDRARRARDRDGLRRPCLAAPAPCRALVSH